ncbi:YybS family protein [Halalkalibacterium ligniniphilum]|uniref:YybS family protein n=1 Tax=Halalkalibacterium ligniniphilum TaxID=1134413 RepID=UPI00034A8CAE|nr:YybS family protein [Halalkalibacterium ligniniphilum]
MKRTRALTEGAIIAALFAILLFLTLYMPFISMVTVWLLPLPFIIYTLRHSLKQAILLWFAAFGVSFMIGGLLALLPVFMFGTAGIVIGELYRREKSPLAVLLGGSLTYIAWMLIFFVGSIVVLDANPLDFAQESMRQSVETAEQVIVSMGQEPAEALEQMNELIDLMVYMAPVMIIMVGIVLAVISQLVSVPVLRRLRHEVQPFPPVRTWSFPKAFLYYYLIVVILTMVGMEEGSTLYIAIWNLFPILEVVMTIQGFAVIFFYCHQKQLSKALPIIILIGSLIVTPLLFFVRILGIIDLGFDLRKRLESRGK